MQNNFIVARTKWIELFHNIDSHNYPVNYSDRALKIIFDPFFSDDTSACNELKTHLNKMDNYLSSNKFKKMFFGDKMDRCEYQPYIKTSNKTFFVECCYAKFRKNDKNENTTNLVEVKNGKKNKKEIRSFHNLFYELKSVSKVRFFFEHGAIWFKKYLIGGEKKIIYGVDLTILSIEYEKDSSDEF